MSVPFPQEAYFISGFELKYHDLRNMMHFFPTYPENYDTKEGFCFLN